MTRVLKIQLFFFFFIAICIILLILAFTSFDFIEINKASDWTIKYFTLPIVLITVPTSYWVYIKFLEQYEAKKYKSRIVSNLRKYFKISLLSLALTGILFATILSLIILSNAYLGNNKTITLHSKIINFYSTTTSGRTRFYIKLQDDQLKRVIELKVQKPYQIGEIFDKTLKVGKWGLLYSEK